MPPKRWGQRERGPPGSFVQLLPHATPFHPQRGTGKVHRQRAPPGRPVQDPPSFLHPKPGGGEPPRGEAVIQGHAPKNALVHGKISRQRGILQQTPGPETSRARSPVFAGHRRSDRGQILHPHAVPGSRKIQRSSQRSPQRALSFADAKRAVVQYDALPLKIEGAPELQREGVQRQRSLQVEDLSPTLQIEPVHRELVMVQRDGDLQEAQRGERGGAGRRVQRTEEGHGPGAVQRQAAELKKPRRGSSLEQTIGVQLHPHRFRPEQGAVLPREREAPQSKSSQGISRDVLHVHRAAQRLLHFGPQSVQKEGSAEIHRQQRTPEPQPQQGHHHQHQDRAGRRSFFFLCRHGTSLPISVSSSREIVAPFGALFAPPGRLIHGAFCGYVDKYCG